jgi:hypothetical protein
MREKSKRTEPVNEVNEPIESFEDAIPKPQSIYHSIWKIKKELGKVTKGSDNPYFKSKYADLNTIIEAIEPILMKYDFILLQPIENGDVVSRVIQCDTGEYIESRLQLPIISDPQKLIACCTYFRRATLQSLFSMQAVDDDGNAAREGVNETQANPVYELNEKQFQTALNYIKTGQRTKDDIKSKYALTTEQLNTINEL